MDVSSLWLFMCGASFSVGTKAPWPPPPSGVDPVSPAPCIVKLMAESFPRHSIPKVQIVHSQTNPQ